MARTRHRIPHSLHPVNLAQQSEFIKCHFPNFSWQIRKGEAIWRGSLQPRITSPTYSVEIRYKLMEIPRVRVISPPLMPDAPHLYPDGSLCLYWPREWRWKQDLFIGQTILPWTASWLFYYELWLDTDKWLGPSSHDQVTERKICQHA